MSGETVQSVTVEGALVDAFHEVIEMMFGLAMEGPDENGEASGLRMSGMIGLAGPSFRGLLRISCTNEGARKLAGALLGGEDMIGDDLSMIADGLGELTNMLGGAIKRQIDVTGAKIELSLPSVLEGEGTIHGIGATGATKWLWTVEGLPVQTSLVYSRHE